MLNYQRVAGRNILLEWLMDEGVYIDDMRLSNRKSLSYQEGGVSFALLSQDVGCLVLCSRLVILICRWLNP